jgi:hypothetical protein
MKFHGFGVGAITKRSLKPDHEKFEESDQAF